MDSTQGKTAATVSPLLDKSLQILGWDRIRAKLAEFALSPYTAECFQSLLPYSQMEEAESALQETRDMVSLLDSPDGFPLESFEDIRPFLKEAKDRMMIESHQALLFIRLLKLVRNLDQYFRKREEESSLNGLGETLEPLPALLKSLETCIDDDGEIRPNASPELKQAFKDVNESQGKLQEMSAKILSSSRTKDAIQDSYHTQREGRWVIPIKSEMRSRIEGIVHDTSGSGATVYLEPSSMVPLNNRLKMDTLRVEREKRKILGRLAVEIHQAAASLMQNLGILETFDRIHAKARLARWMDALPCHLNDKGCMNLVGARNPELILNEQNVIANDITWSPETRVILISGPNTGGKTVTLKTLGLMALMARSGLYLPVEGDSEIPFFPEVYADIGDEQSIQLNLSTFSGHIKKVIQILDEALPGSLILLDELGISTDPTEGAALAEAILKEMKRRDMVTLVSTHYLSLKLLAQTEEGFLNACMEFNTQTFNPTYRLILGVPGNSAALDTAERLGLPDTIIKNARHLFEKENPQEYYLLQDLNRQMLELNEEKVRLHSLKESTEQLNKEQNQLTHRLREELRDFEKSKAKQIQSFVREKKNEIRKLIEQAKKIQNPQGLKKIEKRITSKSPIPAKWIDIPEGWTLAPDELKKGDTVLIQTYGSKGTLLEDPEGKSRVRVQMGNMATLVDKKALRGHKHESRSGPKSQKNSAITVNVQAKAPPSNSCNLHGMRYEEAQEAVESFVSQALANKLKKIIINHGHGTGTIKKLVRNYLERTGLAKHSGPGTLEEGGDGVTVIEF